MKELESRRWVDVDHRHIWHPFANAWLNSDLPLVVSGEGARLTLADGREIVDCISSWWVNVFGHANRRIAEAIAEQAHRLEHVIFAGFTHQPAAELAERLAAMLPGPLNRVFFSDNGSTSVEVALKAAWQYWQEVGQPERTRIMAFDGGYHGDTVGAMSAGVGSGYFSAWNSQLFDCDVMPYPATHLGDDDVVQSETAALEHIRAFVDQHGKQTAAMIIEPLVQGASGMRMARAEFVRALVDTVREAGILVIFDEVMTGFGRTGSRFACDHVARTPDMICLSKGLTGGFLPMSVTVFDERIYSVFCDQDRRPMFCHGHSYTANPLGCAAALAVMDLLDEEATAESWKRIEAHHHSALESIADAPRLREAFPRPRVCGTIAAVNVAAWNDQYQSENSRALAKWFQEERGVLIRPLGNVLYLLPPYCITENDLEKSWAAILECVDRIVAK